MSYLDATLQYARSKAKHLEAEVKFCVDGRSFDNSPKVIQQYLDTTFDDTKAMVIALIQKYKINVCKIEQSMRFIYTVDSESMLVHERQFEDGKQLLDKKKTFKKFKITHPIYGVSRRYPVVMPYKITFATEEPSSSDASDVMKNAQQVRIRLRASFPSVIPGWQIDVTLTKVLDESFVVDPKTIAPVKEQMFPAGINPDNFIDLAPWQVADSIEVEVEYTGDVANLDQTLMAVAINKVLEDLHIDKVDTKYEYQVALWKTAQMLERQDANKFQPPNAKYGIKQLSTPVDNLTKLNWYENVKPSVLQGKYTVSDKPDGNRCLVSIRAPIFIKSEKPSVFKKRTLGSLLTYQLEQFEMIVPVPKDDKDAAENCQLVVDAEKIGNTLYVFDVLIYNSVCITDRPYRTRKSLINNICTILNTYENATKFEPKYIQEITGAEDYCAVIETTNSREKPYESDGLIFTPIDEGYSATIYKWKNPLVNNTIDFLIMKAPDNLIGIHPYAGKANMTLYILFCGIRRDHFDMFGPSLIQNYADFFGKDSCINIEFGKPYFPVQFAPADRPYAHLYWSKNADLGCKVGEFLYKPATEEWVMLRIREDRDVEVMRGTYYGNDMRIAEDNWRSYHNPLMLKEIVDPTPTLSYFNEESSGVDALRKYCSKIKYRLLRLFERAPWLIDLASGRGHLMRPCYINNIANCVFVDKDATALDALIRRKYEHKAHFIVGTDEHKSHRINMYTLTADLAKPADTTVETLRHNMIPLPPAGANVITCHFAIHYWMGTQQQVANFVELCDGLLAPKGSVVITCMDGAKVFDMLEETAKYEVDSDNKCKEEAFCIERKYPASMKLESVGQKISVKLPFSSVPYEEYLVNLTYLKKAFMSQGFKVTEQSSFIDLEHQFRIPLAANERRYIELMIYLVLTR